MKTLLRRFLPGLFMIGLLAPAVAGQQKPTAGQPPDDILVRKANVISEGTQLSAEIFSRKSLEGQRLPTIILCHGWGGVASALRPEAVAFAKAGYLAVTFDYRGWGASDARIVLAKPPEKTGAVFNAEVKEVREVVDPLDQTTDLLNVIHWVHGEPMCDTGKIGLWGSSYSGGHVVYAAARDQRVKATVSQVPALDSRALGRQAATYAEATKRTRGEIGYPQPGAKVVGTLRGAPIRERMVNYAPVEDADKAPGCAMLFILAEKEELFDNREHGIRAHERAKGPKKLVTIPGITHYGVYLQARPQAQTLALAWYDEHLKGASGAAQKGQPVTFGKTAVGQVPAGWKVDRTGEGKGSEWKVVADETAPSKSNRALAQLAESPRAMFNLCVADDLTAKDVELSVAFKAVSGKVDQGGGVVWRYQDANNYYVARANPLELNYRVYKVVNGKRIQLATREELTIPANTWHILKIQHVGDRIECFLNGAKHLEAKDDAIPKAGKIGLWTKADARTYFDRVELREVSK